MEKEFNWTDDQVIKFTRFFNNSSEFENLADSLKRFKSSLNQNDYDILSVRRNGFGDMDYETIWQLFYPTREKWANEVLASQGWYISKIQRRTDGEVFTIGDKIRHKNHNSDDVKTITGFRQVGDTIMVGYSDTAAYWLKNAVKVKREKLFTTHDGKDIYPGDSFWKVGNDKNGRWKAMPMTASFGRGEIIDTRRTFSSEQFANDYIIWNEPVLPLKLVIAMVADIVPTSRESHGNLLNALKKWIQNERTK